MSKMREQNKNNNKIKKEVKGQQMIQEKDASREARECSLHGASGIESTARKRKNVAWMGRAGRPPEETFE